MANEPTYLNPVYRRACPDPFVLKFRGEYWCYCTGLWTDGNCFGVLASADLIHWQDMGGAMPPLPGESQFYWAPEVTYFNGHFYLYYSTGNEETMQIRVAVADYPSGPFIDSGKRLTQEPFAIDAHLFEDDDGSRYLFYATNFLQHAFIGTGTMRDRFLDPFTLEGQPRPVTRARYDWQVYDPHRHEKGDVRWHTVEGPFVLKHKGACYQMFSGGNWKNSSYGVSYAVGSPAQEAEWEQAADGVSILPILRSLPEQGVIGPGHNSVVRGPDNRQLFCIYHRWDVEMPPTKEASGSQKQGLERVLAIDRLEWIGDRLAVLGPSYTPQPVPLIPTHSSFVSIDPNTEQCLGRGWRCIGGSWAVREGMAIQGAPQSGRLSEASLEVSHPNFLLEVSLKAMTTKFRAPSAFGVILDGVLEDDSLGEILRLTILPRTNIEGSATAMISIGSGEALWERPLDLPQELDPRVWHLLRIEVNGTLVFLTLDGNSTHWQGFLPASPTRVCLYTMGMPAAFSAFELTGGWEDLFNSPAADPAALGWQAQGQAVDWQIHHQQLWHTNLAGQAARLFKGSPVDSYELVVNVRLDRHAEDGTYGFDLDFDPQDNSNQDSTLVILQHVKEGWVLAGRIHQKDILFTLPETFDPYRNQQFRFRKENGIISLQWEAQVLGDIQAPSHRSHFALYCQKAIVAFDMVRFTQIPNGKS